MALSGAERQRRWRERHPDRVKVATKKYYAANREQELARNAKWRSANKARRTAYQKVWSRSETGKASQAAYHVRNRAGRLAANKQWRERNRERRGAYLRAYWHIKRARKLGASGSCSMEQWQARFQYFGGRCWMCGGDADTVDHVIPLANGGTNWPSNLRPACGGCNSAKGARSWRIYAQKESA